MEKKKNKKKKISRAEVYKRSVDYNKKYPIHQWDDIRLLTMYHLLTNSRLFNLYIRTKKQPLNMKTMLKPKQ